MKLNTVCNNPVLHRATQQDIRVDYELGAPLGSGGFGIVRSCRRVDREGEEIGKEFACKIIDKKKWANQVELLVREIDILRDLSHPNIVNMYESYEDAKYIYIVMDKLSGGELFERIFSRGNFTEQEAAVLVQEMMRAVNYLHSNGIAHRDLKPENFLFEDKSTKAALKLIDFGLSNKLVGGFENQRKMDTLVGSPYFIAPEVLKGSYGPEWDVWSIGVIMYLLLSGRYPFEGETQPIVFMNIINAQIDIKYGIWTKISHNAKDLIKSLLKPEPQARIKLDEALEHPWFSQKIPGATITFDKEVIRSLINYQATSTFQKEAMNVLVRQMKVNEIRELRDMFVSMDADKTGKLSYEEIKQALIQAGYNPAAQQIDLIIQNADFIGDGKINYTEFLAATAAQRLQVREEDLWSVFTHFDIDNSEYISADNLWEVMQQAGRNVTVEEVKKIISEVDQTADGMISFEEFKKLMIPGLKALD